MGEALALVGKAREAKATLRGITGTGNNVDTSDPGVQLPAPPSMGMAASASGASPVAAPQGMAIALPSDTQASATAPTAPVDNPYVPDTPKDLNQGEDVTVTGDTFRPKHESTLGKIADTLLLLRGRAPVFRQRTDAANMSEAMKGYDSDPDAAIRRVNLVDPDAALKLRQAKQVMDANKTLEDERVQAMREKGFDRLGAMAGAITSSRNPEKAYGDMLPTLRNYAGMYHLDGDSMFPDKYDPDTIGRIRQGGLTTYQQEALANQDNTNQRLTDQNAASLGQSQARIGIDLMNANENIRHDKVMEGAAAGKAANSSIRAVTTKFGPGQMSSDGNRLVVYQGGKTFRFMKVINGNGFAWQKIAESDTK